MKMILTYNITQMCGLAGVSYKTSPCTPTGEPCPARRSRWGRRWYYSVSEKDVIVELFSRIVKKYSRVVILRGERLMKKRNSYAAYCCDRRTLD